MKIHLLTLIGMIVLTVPNVNARSTVADIDDDSIGNGSSAPQATASRAGDQTKQVIYKIEDLDAIEASTEESDTESSVKTVAAEIDKDGTKNGSKYGGVMPATFSLRNASAALKQARQNEEKKKKIAEELLKRLDPTDLSNKQKRDELVRLLIKMGLFS